MNVMRLDGRWTRLVVAAGFTLAAIGVMATPAGAYALLKSSDCTMKKIKNPGGVHIVVHTSSLLGSDLQVSNMLAAVNAVVDEFNTVGGTAAHISSVTTSTDAYHHTTSYHESTGTIHLGFTSVVGAGDDVDGNAVGEAKPFEVTRTISNGDISIPTPCTVASPNIGFLDLVSVVPGHVGWNFRTPGDTDRDQGNKYYQAGESDIAGHLYFRPIVLHELLHAFGLAHSANTTAFMNYGTKPWINRSRDKMITPLPDDLAALRYLYPAGGDVYRMALLNTALNPSAPLSDSGAGIQSPLCHPSGGTTYAPLFDSYGCATSAVYKVCAGAPVYGAYSLANYSTSAMNVTVGAWFSTDDVWDWDDHEAVDYDSFTISAGKTALFGDHWTMPSMLVGTQHLYVILRVIATKDTPGSAPPADSVTTDWLPLYGTVTTC
jgi:hypothetical protein